MALSRLPASADFFKQLSHDYNQLKFILHIQETFAYVGLTCGYELESCHLLYIIEQLEVLISQTQQLKHKVEERLQDRPS